MARTESTMLALGTPAPDFELPDVVSGKTVALEGFADKKALLVMFICRHCPFVKHVHSELARLGKDYGSQSLGIVAISRTTQMRIPTTRLRVCGRWLQSLASISRCATTKARRGQSVFSCVYA